ncbi:MAG TPA: N,N-dimethylformamidase beta subunit family domain-containing protein [Thermoanaerobaculia bacterium]|nr:N,N-dimethylformamidase beta subunit family domain-containing protein [Thermoanaerobaculia bacterium]
MRHAFILAIFIASTVLGNPIQDENARPGTSAWKLAAGRSTDIEGYASLTSVNVGGSISFYVSTTAQTFDIDVFRMGWYGGLGGRRVFDADDIAGHMQPVPTPDPVTGLIECQWTDPYTITIPNDWVSGVYIAKLTAQPGGQQNWIMFVVRDDARASGLLFQSSVTTMNAYNGWGGKSLYPFNSTGPQAAKVSFDRPYGAGAGFTEFQRWEYPTIRFLEREGYDVTYCTNIDTHAQPDTLLRHRAFLSVGHDEYWSYEMRRNVERARDRGVNLAFLSSNTSYWQIRLETDSKGQPNRTIVGYKESALSSDPIAKDGDPTNDYLVTTLWRNPPINLPEEMLIGSMWTFHNGAVTGDIVVENTSHWVFMNTGLKPGDHLSGLLGYEVDRMFSAFPSGTIRLAHSPFNNNGITDYSDMTIYQAVSGAYVFSTGSMEWAYGLDDTGTRESPTPPGGWISPAAQQITRNVLERFTGRARRRSVGRR